MRPRSFSRCFVLIFSVSVTLSLLCGCGMGVKAPASGAQGVALKGGVHGGEQPITGAKIYLYDAGSGGYDTAATSLLCGATTTVTCSDPLTSSTVLADGNGNGYVLTGVGGTFNISGDWSCPSGTDQIYILALGGNPGLTPGTDNPGIALMTALGECDNILANYSFININEVTTVASVWALQNFLKDATDVGSSNSNYAFGLANAFQTVPNLVDINLGTALSATSALNSTGAVPHTELYTLADILAYCTNSDGVTITDTTTDPGTPLTNCGTLFYDATPSGAPLPTDTIGAALMIARNPGNNASNGVLLGLTSAQSPFQDKIADSAPYPNDWTVSIAYTGGGLTTPAGLAVDASGNIWVANENVNSTIHAFDVSEFNNLGSDLTGGNGYTNAGVSGPIAVAIDTTGNAWVADHAGVGGSNYDISEFDPSGNDLSSGGYFSPSLDQPGGIAIDKFGNVWVTDSVSSNSGVSEFTSSGMDESPGCPSSCVAFTGGGLSIPFNIAADGSGNVWIANGSVGSGGYDISYFNGSGDLSGTGNGYIGPWIDQPYAVAVDGSGNIWYTNDHSASPSVGEISNTNADLTGSNGYALPSGSAPTWIALDGGGNVWVTDANKSVIYEMASAGFLVSPSTGYKSSALSSPGGIAVDGSGNVWVASSSNNKLVEFVGTGMPVVTPLAVGEQLNALTSEP